VIKEIEELHNIKRPVLVGTTSIEDSEEVAFLLNKKGIPYNILNAKYHEREAYIIAQAGRLGVVTIATNMAGRGTDIILGGNLDYFIKNILRRNNINLQDSAYGEEYEKLYLKYEKQFKEENKKVIELGGVHIIGTQRHEARRIDNQLRGRSGRQGDPGSSRFYVSLEDDLMRLFGSERIYGLMEAFGFPEDQPIEHGIVNRSLAIAQKRVETHNFEIRKQLLQYDNIMNKQREVIYRQRRQILEDENIREEILSMLREVIERNVPLYFQEDRDLLGLTHWFKSKFNLDVSVTDLSELTPEEVVEIKNNELKDIYIAREKDIGAENIRQMEKMAALWIVDLRWKEHLLTMDYLREGIHLRAHAHVDPLVEYQKESYLAFQDMIIAIKEGIVDMVFKTKVQRLDKEIGVFSESPKSFVHSQYSSLNREEEPPASSDTQKVSQATKKVGRNDPCPCGSGKKYKKCCGK
jgi:preprotein translocase subunit SecA